ncbi:MAG: tRNA-dihydrouridine synthase [Endomicrobia bacterium]|nr:tRNA-dihydrouridine synthase [Endomicrobiia bacterium]
MTKPLLNTNVGKLYLENPVIIASGICSFGEENVSVLNKCGAVVFKTVTLYPKEGNPTPRVVDFSFGMLNTIGLENPGVENIKEKVSYIKKIKCRKIASFLAYEDKEFEIILNKLENYNVFDGYEINLSCPNVKKGSWFYDIKKLEKLLSKLRKSTNKPLISKISVENNIFETIKILQNNGYDGVTLLNTYKAVAVDYKKLRFKLSTIYGGYSGPAIKPLVQRWVYDVKKNFNIDVVASGGVFLASDVLEYLLLGAKAVQIGSAYFRNPGLPIESIKFLRSYLENKSIKDILGTLIK